MQSNTLYLGIAVVAFIGFICFCSIVAGWIAKRKKAKMQAEKKKQTEERNQQMKENALL